MAKLPLAPCERILRRVGGDTRVSEEATRAFRDVVEDYAWEIAERANKLARHAGRKTIMEEDVRLAKR